jgi:thiamine-monophosphate kinase
MSEFDIIKRYFAKRTPVRDDVILGPGDDAALLKVPEGQELAVSMDTLVAGVHFLESIAPRDLGYKAVAVNLSDLAAMGATPAWITFALTLPEINEEWLSEFSAGFFELINEYSLQLVGGDLTRGPLSMTGQVHGFVPPHQALRRSNAKPGDHIYVTGQLGDAAYAVRSQEKNSSLKKSTFADQRLHRPTPRVEAGLALRNIAHAAVDVSDGLVADLGHMLKMSGVGARVMVEELPLSSSLREHLSAAEAKAFALTGGDDYELCFTVPPDRVALLNEVSKSFNCDYTLIGEIEVEAGLRVLQSDGSVFKFSGSGFQHF